MKLTRQGISLMEVILALAILSGAMVTIGYLMKIAGRHATEADVKSRGQMICQAVLSQIDAGIIPATAVQQTAVDANPEWVYSIDVQQQPTIGLIAVTVTAQREDDDRRIPIQARLVRWMVDPAYLQEIVDAAAEAAAEQEEENAIL